VTCVNRPCPFRWRWLFQKDGSRTLDGCQEARSLLSAVSFPFGFFRSVLELIHACIVEAAADLDFMGDPA